MEASREKFSKFVSYCQSVTDNDYEVVKVLQRKFNKCNPEFIESNSFHQLIKNTTKQVKEDAANKYVHIRDFVTELKAYELKEKKTSKRPHEGPDTSDISDAPTLPESKRQRRVELTTISKPDDNVLQPLQDVNTLESKFSRNDIEYDDEVEEEEEEEEEAVTNSNYDACEDDVELLNDDDNIYEAQSHITDSDIEVIAVTQDKTTPDISEDEEIPRKKVKKDKKYTKKKSPSHEGRGSGRQVKKLEKLLEEIRDEIEELENKELSVDDLVDADNTYVYIDKYKKKFVQVWKKLCEVKGRAPTTGRSVERRFRFEGTRYPEINRKIEKFINKFQQFPDYQDIRDIVIRCNVRHKLRLSKGRIDSVARDAFTEVGDKLQERRKEDFKVTLESNVTGLLQSRDDPAMYDRDLRKKLEANKQIGHNKMAQVIKKYAEKQEDGDDTTDDDDDDDEEENDEIVDENETKTSKRDNDNDQKEVGAYEDGQDLLDYKKFLLNDHVKEKNKNILNRILNDAKTKLKSPVKMLAKSPLKAQSNKGEGNDLNLRLLSPDKNPLTAFVKIQRLNVTKSPVKVAELRLTPNKKAGGDDSIIILDSTPVKLDYSLSPVVKLKRVKLSKDVSFNPYDDEIATTSKDPSCMFMSFDKFQQSHSDDSIESVNERLNDLENKGDVVKAKTIDVSVSLENIFDASTPIINKHVSSLVKIASDVNKITSTLDEEVKGNSENLNGTNSNKTTNGVEPKSNCRAVVSSQKEQVSELIQNDKTVEIIDSTLDSIIDQSNLESSSESNSGRSHKFEIYIDRACDDNYETNLVTICDNIAKEKTTIEPVQIKISGSKAIGDVNGKLSEDKIDSSSFHPNKLANERLLSKAKPSVSELTTDNQVSQTDKEEIVSSTSDHMVPISEDVCTSTIDDNDIVPNFPKSNKLSLKKQESKSVEVVEKSKIASSQLKINVSTKFRDKLKLAVRETLSSRESGESSGELSHPSSPKRKSFLDLEQEKTLMEEKQQSSKASNALQKDVADKVVCCLVGESKQTSEQIKFSDILSLECTSTEDNCIVKDKIEKLANDGKSLDDKTDSEQKEIVVKIDTSQRILAYEKAVSRTLENSNIIDNEDIIIDESFESEYDENDSKYSSEAMNMSQDLAKIANEATEKALQSILDSSCSVVEQNTSSNEGENNRNSEPTENRNINVVNNQNKGGSKIASENDKPNIGPTHVSESSEVDVAKAELYSRCENDKPSSDKEKVQYSTIAVRNDHMNIAGKDTKDASAELFSLTMEVEEEPTANEIPQINQVKEVQAHKVIPESKTEKPLLLVKGKQDDLASLAQALVQQAVAKLNAPLSEQQEAENIVQRAIAKLNMPLPDKESPDSSKTEKSKSPNTDQKEKSEHSKEKYKKSKGFKDNSVEIVSVSSVDQTSKHKSHKHKKRDEDYAVKIVGVTKPEKSEKYSNKKEGSKEKCKKSHKEYRREDSVIITGGFEKKKDENRDKEKLKSKHKYNEISSGKTEQHRKSHHNIPVAGEKNSRNNTDNLIKKKAVSKDDDVSIVEVIDDEMPKNPVITKFKGPVIPPVQRVFKTGPCPPITTPFTAATTNMNSIIKNIATKITLEGEIDALRKETQVEKLNLKLRQGHSPVSSQVRQSKPGDTLFAGNRIGPTSSNLTCSNLSPVPVNLYHRPITSNKVLTSTPIVANNFTGENLSNTVSVTRIKRKVFGTPEMATGNRPNFMPSPNMSSIKTTEMVAGNRPNLMPSPNMSCIKKIDNSSSSVMFRPPQLSTIEKINFDHIAKTVSKTVKSLPVKNTACNEPTSTRDDLSEEEIIGSSGQPPELGDPSSVIVLEDSD